MDDENEVSRTGQGSYVPRPSSESETSLEVERQEEERVGSEGELRLTRAAPLLPYSTKRSMRPTSDC